MQPPTGDQITLPIFKVIVYTVVPPMYAPADIFSNLDVYLRIKTKLVTAGAERAVQYMYKTST